MRVKCIWWRGWSLGNLRYVEYPIIAFMSGFTLIYGDNIEMIPNTGWIYPFKIILKKILNYIKSFALKKWHSNIKCSPDLDYTDEHDFGAKKLITFFS